MINNKFILSKLSLVLKKHYIHEGFEKKNL